MFAVTFLGFSFHLPLFCSHPWLHSFRKVSHNVIIFSYFILLPFPLQPFCLLP